MSVCGTAHAAKTVYARAGGGDWNADATWSTSSGGAADTTYPVATDTVYLDSASGNVTINVASACAIVDCTGYTGTLTQSARMETSGNVTFVSGMTFTYTGTPTWVVNLNTSMTLTSAGKSFYKFCWDSDGNETITLADPMSVVTSFGFNDAGTTGQGVNTLNGSTLTCNGLDLNGANLYDLLGTTNITLTGGTWSSNQETVTNLQNNLTINGDVTISGTVKYSTGTLAYTSGTITGTNTPIVSIVTNSVSITALPNVTTTFTVDATLSGNLTIMSGATVTVTDGKILTVTGTTTNSGTATLATTTFTGNLTLEAGSSTTIYAGKTVNVLGTFTAEGTSGSHITLQSGTATSAAYFYPETLGTITYVDATDINSNGSPIQTPDMTSLTDPSGTASASSAYSTYAAWKAFDRTTAPVDGNRWGSFGTGAAWLQFAFDNGLSAKTIGSYRVYSDNGGGWGIINTWTLEGSNTGAFGGEEVELDSQAGQSGLLPKTYVIASPASYIYYRVVMDGSPNWVSVTELELYGVPPEITTTGGSITRTVNWVLAPGIKTQVIMVKHSR